MNVVSIDPKTKQKQQRKEELLEVLDTMKKMVETGEIEEFVAASIQEEGAVQIHAVVKDVLGGIGLFEIGKKIIIDQHELM